MYRETNESLSGADIYDIRKIRWSPSGLGPDGVRPDGIRPNDLSSSGLSNGLCINGPCIGFDKNELGTKKS